MKKIIWFLTAISVAASLILVAVNTSVVVCFAETTSVQAVVPPESDFTYIENGDGTLTITKYNGSETDIVFPAEIDGKRVTKIGSGRYYDAVLPEHIMSVVVPEGIEVIDEFAFVGYSGGDGSSNPGHRYDNFLLRSVMLPESLRTIKSFSFWGGPDLTTIKIPKNVCHISNSVFCACYSMTSIEVDEENQYFSSEDGVLFDKNKTILMYYPSKKQDSEYTIPSTVKKIDPNAIMDCRNLKKINILEGTEHIGINAFWGMELETITIPSTLNRIDGTYLSYMSDTVVICEESVDQNLISEAKSVINYRIENGEAKITNYRGIQENIEIPTDINSSAVTSIGSGAFANTSIASIAIPDTVQNIESGAFSGCNNLGLVGYYNNTAVADDAFPTDTIQLSYMVTLDGVTVEVVSKGNQNMVLIPDNIGGVPVTNIDVGETGAVVEHNHSGGTASCIAKAVCTVCGQEYGNFSEHVYDGGRETTAPTCTEKGVTTYTCTVVGCGETKSEDILVKGHSYVDGKCMFCQATDLNYTHPTETFPTVIEPPVKEPATTETTVSIGKEEETVPDGKTQQTASPNTGDTVPIAVVFMLMFVSVVLVVISVKYIKKNK